MIIPGGLDDQTIHLSWGFISNSLFNISDPNLNEFYVYRTLFGHLLNPLSANQPLSTLFLSVGLSVFGPNFYFFISLISIVITLLFSYLLFKKYKYSVAWALIFTFSSYMWSHLWKHIDLLQIWIFPLFFILLSKFFRVKTLKSPVILGVFFVASTLISNYAGFIIFIYFIIACAVKLIYQWLSTRNIEVIILKRAILTVLVFVGLSYITLFQYIQANYFGRDKIGLTVTRTYEDFFVFSSRPWYFFIPPVKNPWLGSFSADVLENIKQSNYFLADDYFANEHQGNYFGFVFLITSLTLVIWSYKNSIESRKKIAIYMLCNILLYSLMFPPFLTISGINIYTPGIIIYKYFPMFRVTSRFSIILLLNLLIIMAYIIDKNFEKIKKKIKYINIIIISFTAITLIETFIPFDFVKKEIPPNVYLFLNKNTSENTIFAVYPNNATLDALYWVYAHKRNLLNPKYYSSQYMDSEEFTKNLNTNEGIYKLLEFDGEYLIVFKNITREDREFFENEQNLTIVNEFEDSYLYKVEDI